MSELIAEARVLVTPDTTAFRTQLIAQTEAAAKGVTVPVTVTPVVSGAGATASAAAGSVTQGVEKEISGATAAQARFQAQQDKFLAQRATQETAASDIRIAQREREVATLLAQEKTLLANEEKFAADRVTADTAASDARIAAKQREVAALLAADRKEEASAIAAAEKQAAAGAATLQARLAGLASGSSSAALSLVGLRGATLAASGPFLAGAAGAIAFGKAISIATSFNQELSVFAATTGATADEMERVSAAARQLGKDITLPGVSAGDAAEAMTEFAKAGLSVNDAIAGTRGGLQLATAAQLSNADAVTLAASALNAFKLSGDQAVSVADTLANAANSAQGSIADIGLGLKQSAAAAELVGVSFKDTTALLTLLAKNGLTASDAGTSLRTAFIRLVNPTEKARKILENLNVQLRDAQGNVRPEVFAEFARAQQNLAVSTQQANAAVVFGSDAFRAFGILASEGAAGLDQTRRALDEQGTAARVAGARMVGLAGETANLQNQLEALGLSIGKVATPALQALVGEIAQFAEIANQGITAAGDLKKAIELIPGAQQGEGFFASVAKDIVKFSPSTPVGIVNIAKTVKDAVTTTDDELVSAGAVLRSSIEDAGREAARGAVPFATQITSALDAAFKLVNDKLKEKAQEIRSNQLQRTAGGAGQQAGLEELFNQIVGGGGSAQAQIANLQRQAKVQADIISGAGPNAAGVLLERRRAAREKLAQINGQITSIEKGIAADQEAAAKEQQQVRDDAKRARDQEFLQAQQDARSRQDRLVTLADETPAVADDIRRQEQLRQLIRTQIAALKASAVEETAKAAAIRQLRQAQDATNDELRRLRATQKANQAEQRQAAQEEITANLALRTQIAEARDASTSLLVKRIDAQIADARKAQAGAKKGSKAWLEATLALEELRKKRRETIEAAKEKDDSSDDSGLVGGTSLVDLFTRAEDITRQAGNVGQTAASLADLSAVPRIQQEVQARLNIVNPQADRQQRSTDQLTAAIVQLTNTITGNFSLGVPVAGAPRNRAASIGSGRALTEEQRFFFQKQAKAMVEQGLTG